MEVSRQNNLYHGGEYLNQVLCKWILDILFTLSDSEKRFSQIKRALNINNNKILVEKLNMLINLELVRKISSNGHYSYYSLTQKGRELLSLMTPIVDYGIRPSAVSDVLKCKWMVNILRTLLRNESLFASELFSRLSGITWKILSERLRKLERYGFVERKVVINTYPVRIKYRLTREGKVLARWIELNSIPKGII